MEVRRFVSDKYNKYKQNLQVLMDPLMSQMTVLWLLCHCCLLNGWHGLLSCWPAFMSEPQHQRGVGVCLTRANKSIRGGRRGDKEVGLCLPSPL